MKLSDKGQSLVELAVSLTILIYLLSGAIEFGIAFFQYVQLRDAAQEGALYGSVCQDPAQIEARARGASSEPIDLAGPDVEFFYEYVTDTPEGAIQVTLVYQHKIFMPFMTTILQSSHISLRAAVTNTILTTEGCSNGL